MWTVLLLFIHRVSLNLWPMTFKLDLGTVKMNNPSWSKVISFKSCRLDTHNWPVAYRISSKCTCWRHVLSSVLQQQRCEMWKILDKTRETPEFWHFWLRRSRRMRRILGLQTETTMRTRRWVWGWRRWPRSDTGSRPSRPGVEGRRWAWRSMTPGRSHRRRTMCGYTTNYASSSEDRSLHSSPTNTHTSLISSHTTSSHLNRVQFRWDEISEWHECFVSLYTWRGRTHASTNVHSVSQRRSIS